MSRRPDKLEWHTTVVVPMLWDKYNFQLKYERGLYFPWGMGKWGYIVMKLIEKTRQGR